MKKLISGLLVLSLLIPLSPIAVAEEGEQAQVSEPAPVAGTATSTPEVEVPPVAETATSTPAVEVATTTPTEVEEVVIVAPEDTVELIVKLTDDSVQTVAAVEAESDVTVTESLTEDTIVVEATNMSVEEAADLLEDLPSVEYAEPNYSRTSFALSDDFNDTHADNMWALDNTAQTIAGVTGTSGADIDAVRAWDLLQSASTTVVAVIDSGVLYSHPDLNGNMWDGTNCKSDTGAALNNCIHGYDFADNDLDPAPVLASTTPTTPYEHGTHVAGIIAAEHNNGEGTIGVASSTKIMAIRFGFTVAQEIKAINFARENGVRIINASFGGTGYSQQEYDAIEDFTDAGGIFIAAAGNSNTSNDSAPIYPAAYNLPGIIAVAATDQTDTLASFSNYGPTSVDIGAPGKNIYSTYLSGVSTPEYARANGTSMAAPHVAGVAALIKSMHPSATSTEIIDAILTSGDALSSLTSTTVRGMRLNAYRALQTAGGIDVIAPIITLTGASSISLTVGDAYTELGATATDNRDATTTVVIAGDTVNTSSAGTYTVTYDATDQAGNHATQAARVVTVSAAVSSGGGGGGGGGGSSKSKKKKATVTKYAKKAPVKKTVANPARPALAKPAPPAPPLGSYSPAPQASGVPSTQFVRVLAVGSAGTDVSALQQALTRAGVYAGPVTGYFGPLTQVALRAYQAKHGLDQVGFTGPMTRTFLNQGR